MEKRKSTGDLLDILGSAESCAGVQDAIKDEQLTETLTQRLNRLLVESGAQLPDVMRRSGLKKAYFYSLFDGTRTKPSRDVLIQLCFGFQLGLEESQQLLKHCGAAQLYPRIPRDGVIIYCLQRNMSLMDCDALLMDNGEPLLTKD